MVLTIKREIRRHRYYWVARDNGKIKALTPYKKFKTKQSMIDLFKANNTLDPKRYRKNFTNVYSITDSRNLRREKKNEQIQVLARIYDFDKFILEASSQKSDKKSVNELKQEAEISAYERLAQENGYLYDEEIGKRLLKNNKYRIEFSVIRYRPLR